VQQNNCGRLPSDKISWLGGLTTLHLAGDDTIKRLGVGYSANEKRKHAQNLKKHEYTQHKSEKQPMTNVN